MGEEDEEVGRVMGLWKIQTNATLKIGTCEVVFVECIGENGCSNTKSLRNSENCILKTGPCLS